MAPSRSHAPSSHARLHKRGNSASSIASPSALSPLSDAQAFTFNRSETPKVTYEEPWNGRAHPMPSLPPSHPLKIKPYLRKLSAKDAYSLDLSRPAAENEGLVGLGIAEPTPSASDVPFTGLNSRGPHNRSASNTSQFSTTSSLHRSTAPYMPPIRQTPRPYTPPTSKPSPSSTRGGSENGVGDSIPDDDFRLRQHAFDPARRSGSVSSVPGVAPPLRIQTTGSSTPLGASYSQSTASLTSPGVPSRSRGDTLKSMDTATSPSTRTSFDKAFGLIRGGRDSPVDAASRAASIRAARQAFLEKEEAKARKYDKEASKQAERDNRKLYKKEERDRRKSESQEMADPTRSRSASTSNDRSTPRPSIGGRQYSDHRHAHTRALPATVPIMESEKHGTMRPEVTRTRAAKGRWLRIITWIKTRILRMSNRMHVRS